ncbi:hypothetical protein [Roseovarius phycicola]|uniref:DUF3618 domain-containing protein n=1 Tax=Roseovarius phycicola TaxID=3080976 RepID=A0ABZ2HFG5_9RHOB
MTNVIDQEQFHKRAAHLEEMLHAKLGVRGKTLERKFKRAGRLLPRRMRAAGRVLVETQGKMAHPIVMRQVDPNQVSSAFAELETHLKSIDPADRRRGKVLNWAGGTVMNLLIICALAAAIIRWKGLI